MCSQLCSIIKVAGGKFTLSPIYSPSSKLDQCMIHFTYSRYAKCGNIQQRTVLYGISISPMTRNGKEVFPELKFTFPSVFFWPLEEERLRLFLI